MTAALMPPGKQQYFAGNGTGNNRPLAGGKLYTYDAGTVVPRPTWQDAAQTILNTNPVILDARGEAIVFWSGNYKVVLKDSNDVTIWTVDNIQDYQSLIAQLLSNTTDPAKGSGMVGFNQALNYVARTVGATLQDREIELLNFVTDQAERAAIKAGTSTTDHTSLFVNAFVLGRKVFANAGTWNISEVLIPAACMLEGAGPYTTTIRVIKASVGTNRGIYLRSNTEVESGVVLKNFSMEAKDYSTVGKHSYGLDLANVAHAYVENVHVMGFDRGFYLEDALINTFLRCRAANNHIGVYIDGTEPLGGGPGANKNNWIDLKCTSNGDSVGGGGGILLTGVSSYQNVFMNTDLEFNFTSVSVDGSFDGAHVFYAPYFECNSTNPDQANLIRTMSGTHLILDRPIFGNTGSSTAAYYLDPAFNDGLVEITGGHSNSQSTRCLPPKQGRYEMVGSGAHDVASTSLQTMIDYWKTYTPIAQAGATISGSSIDGYIYGSASGGGTTIRTTFDSDPNNTASWVTPASGTMGQTDPIGGTTAVALVGTFQMLRAVGASTGFVCCQVFAKVTTSTPSEFQLEYWNNGISRIVRPCSFSGTTGWMLLTLDFDLTGKPTTSNSHEFRITGGSGKVTIWWPQIVQGTRLPQPILPLDGGGNKFSAGTGISPSFSTALQMVGLTSYELPKIVKRVSYNGAGGTTATFPPLVDSTAPLAGRIFELVVREIISTTIVITVYNVSLSYAVTTTSAISIKQVSQSVMGSGVPSRVAATVSSLTANSDKSITLTNSDVVTVEATIREIT